MLQALIGYQNSTTAKLGQMKEALVDPALKKSQVSWNLCVWTQQELEAKAACIFCHSVSVICLRV